MNSLGVIDDVIMRAWCYNDLHRPRDLPRKGMSVLDLESSWDSYSRKYLTRSKQCDLLKVQLLFMSIEEVRQDSPCDSLTLLLHVFVSGVLFILYSLQHPASTGHSVNACHDCR